MAAQPFWSSVLRVTRLGGGSSTATTTTTTTNTAGTRPATSTSMASSSSSSSKQSPRSAGLVAAAAAKGAGKTQAGGSALAAEPASGDDVNGGGNGNVGVNGTTTTSTTTPPRRATPLAAPARKMGLGVIETDEGDLTRLGRALKKSVQAVARGGAGSSSSSSGGSPTNAADSDDALVVDDVFGGYAAAGAAEPAEFTADAKPGSSPVTAIKTTTPPSSTPSLTSLLSSSPSQIQSPSTPTSHPYQLLRRHNGTSPTSPASMSSCSFGNSVTSSSSTGLCRRRVSFAPNPAAVVIEFDQTAPATRCLGRVERAGSGSVGPTASPTTVGETTPKLVSEGSDLTLGGAAAFDGGVLPPSPPKEGSRHAPPGPITTAVEIGSKPGWTNTSGASLLPSPSSLDNSTDSAHSLSPTPTTIFDSSPDGSTAVLSDTDADTPVLTLTEHAAHEAHDLALATKIRAKQVRALQAARELTAAAALREHEARLREAAAKSGGTGRRRGSWATAMMSAGMGPVFPF